MGFWDNVQQLVVVKINKTHGWIRQLAKDVGASEHSLASCIRRNSKPSVDTAIKIARALNTTVEALFSGEGLANSQSIADSAQEDAQADARAGAHPQKEPQFKVVETDPTYDPRKRIKVADSYYTDGNARKVVKYMESLSISARMSLSRMSEALAKTQPSIAASIARNASDQAENASVVHPRTNIEEQTSNA